ncbi:hypothetical protein QF031_001161 [Pseudarthrobacter defluvii]|uniref:hypothetical protein n=1 Tax=Pseudarthrobacter defluvii TaxID=410837 RepID=UPI002781AC4D|nr:hypothetical protein [Pseudarthrobacter defluvii]MDQ0768412.1 hypothetical protein [Pseudarthrobacter defluvii]
MLPGTALIGVLLVAVSVVLIAEAKSIMIGEAADPNDVDPIATRMYLDGPLLSGRKSGAPPRRHIGRL